MKIVIKNTNPKNKLKKITSRAKTKNKENQVEKTRNKNPK